MPEVLFGALGIIVIFGAIVAFHELGHFIVAKLSGMEVYEYAIGLGPTIVKRKIGETTYALRALPIGGFVRIAGMEPGDDDSPHGYDKKPFFARYATLVAGATMNFILAFLLILLLGMSIGYMKPGKEVIIGGVVPGSPAYQAGIRPGDHIVRVAGRDNPTADETRKLIKSSNKSVNIVVEREGKLITTDPKLKKVLFPEPDPILGPIYLYKMVKINGIGVQMTTASGTMERQSFGPAVREGGLRVAGGILDGFASFASLVLGRIPISQMSGPLGIMKVSYDAGVGAAHSTTGLANLLMTAAMLSTLIGFFNLLPIPALDGGRAVFLIINAFRRKPIDREKEEYIHSVALMALLGLILLITVINDLPHLLDSVIKRG